MNIKLVGRLGRNNPGGNVQVTEEMGGDKGTTCYPAGN
jgi:hypothetical protein